MRPEGHPGQGRPGPRADDRGRHGSVRQDRHAHAGASRGRPDHRLRRPGHTPRMLLLRGGGRERSSPTRSPWRSCTRSKDPRAVDLPATDEIAVSRWATASPSASRTAPSRSAARASWRWKGSGFRLPSSAPWRRLTPRVTRSIMVAADGQVGGGIELHASVPSGGPRDRRRAAGARHQAPGHHLRATTRRPTRKLAELLGMDRYFAEVLPADKADYVRAAPEGGPQGLLRRRRHQRLDRAQEGQRLDLAAGGLLDRHRHRSDRVHGRAAVTHPRPAGHRPRPRPQRAAELADDPVAERLLCRRRLLPGLRHHGTR